MDRARMRSYIARRAKVHRGEGGREGWVEVRRVRVPESVSHSSSSGPSCSRRNSSSMTSSSLTMVADV